MGNHQQVKPWGFGASTLRTNYVTVCVHELPGDYQKIRLKHLFTFIIVFGTTVWTDSDRGRVKNSFRINKGRTPPFIESISSTFFNRTTSVGNSFIFEREIALATNFARTTYYRTLGWRWNWRRSWRGTVFFIWIVPTVIVTITYIRRWNTFSRIGTSELCWKTLNWNRGEWLHALNSYTIFLHIVSALE